MNGDAAQLPVTRMPEKTSKQTGVQTALEQSGTETLAASHSFELPVLTNPRFGGTGNETRRTQLALALQRTYGNASVQHLLAGRSTLPRVQRQQTSATAPASVPAPQGENASTATPEDQDRKKKLEDAKTPGDIKDIDGYRDAATYKVVSEERRMQLIDILRNQKWVGPYDEYALEAVWGSFDDVAKVVADHYPVWRSCVDKGAELEEKFPQVTAHINQTGDTFKRDVIAVAKAYLAENRRVTILEASRFGIKLGGDNTPAVEQKGYQDDIMAMAKLVNDAVKDRELLRKINVGYKTVIDSRDRTVDTHPLPFSPESKPQDRPYDPMSHETEFFKGPKGDEDPPMPSWDQTKEKWDYMSSVIGGFANLYPVIYTLIQQDKLDELTKTGDSTQAKRVIDESLRKTLDKIAEANDKTGLDQSIDYYDLEPVHTKLFAGTAGDFHKPALDWKQPFNHAVAQGLLEDHKAREFWTSLGLSVLAAAALIAAPFTGGATAALLLGFGLGVGGAQAGLSIDKYLSMSAAGDANVRDELALISKGQIDAARIEAILNTVGVFLDAYGARAARVAGRASRAAAEAAEEGMRKKLADDAKRRMLKEAGKDAAITAGGAAASVAAHELEGDITIESATGIERMQAPIEAEPEPAPVQQLLVQRANGASPAPAPGRVEVSSNRVVGDMFEGYVVGALRRGEVEGMPRMNYVIPLQHKSGQGIDAIGIAIDPASKKMSVYQFEMKYTDDQKPIAVELKQRAAGLQTNREWTQDAIDKLMAADNDASKAAKSELKSALGTIRGKPVDDAYLRRWLNKHVPDAPVRVFAPSYADLRKLYRQVAGMMRWGRDAKVVKLVPPH